ncbi:MAG: MFS transporter [Candidatus Bathyarchaeota archaeon B23]|nr:MAG: MFS transporter [Candidatus Bathyarchaeota archaeon B23]
MSSYTAVYFLALATFITFLSAQLMRPIVPLLAEELGAGGLDIASIGGSYMILLSLFQIFTGALADRYGRRRVILLGASLAAMSSILCAYASSWSHLLILRGLGGLADALVAPSLLALVAELGGERKGWAMGLFRSSQGLAFAVGPMVGGLLAKLFSLYAPIYLDFALTLLALLLFALLPLPEGRRRPLSLPIRSLRLIRGDPNLLRVAVMGFSETFSFSALASFLPAVVVMRGLREVEIALLFSAEAAAFSSSSLIAGPLSDRYGRRRLMLLGLVSCALTTVALYPARGLGALLLLMILYGLSSSIIYLMSSTMAADLLPEEGRATLFGAFDAVMDLGLIVGPSFCLSALKLTRWPLSSSFLIMPLPSIPALILLLGMEETRWRSQSSKSGEG